MSNDVRAYLADEEKVKKAVGKNKITPRKLESVCKKAGQELPNNYWCMMRSEWFNTVDKALKKVKGPKLYQVVFNSSLSENIDQDPDDLVLMGKVSPKEAGNLLAKLEKLPLGIEVLADQSSVFEHLIPTFYHLNHPRYGENACRIVWQDKTLEEYVGKKEMYYGRPRFKKTFNSESKLKEELKRLLLDKFKAGYTLHEATIKVLKLSKKQSKNTLPLEIKESVAQVRDWVKEAQEKGLTLYTFY